MKQQKVVRCHCEEVRRGNLLVQKPNNVFMSTHYRYFFLFLIFSFPLMNTETSSAQASTKI